MIVTILGAGLLLGGLAVFLISGRLLKLSHLTLHSRSTEPRIAILIPARDESRVIEELLKYPASELCGAGRGYLCDFGE